MNHPWTTGDQVLTLGALIPIGSLLAMPLRVSPTLIELLRSPAHGWTALILSWWLPPLLAVPALVALLRARRAPSGALRRRHLLLGLLAGWAALTGVLAGVVAVLVG